MSSCITFQHWHDVGEACGNFDITQEPKNSSHSFDGMEITIILTTKDMYFITTLLAGENTKIHLVFMLQNNLIHFCFK
jgi:hypothetical protein